MLNSPPMANENPAPWTVLRLINWTKDFLSRVGLRGAAPGGGGSAGACARNASAYSSTRGLTTNPRRRNWRPFGNWCSGPRHYEPVAYLVGKRSSTRSPSRSRPTCSSPVRRPRSSSREAVTHLQESGPLGAAAVGTSAPAAGAWPLPSRAGEGRMVIATFRQGHRGRPGERTGPTRADRVRCRVADLLTLPEDCQDMRAVRRDYGQSALRRR